MAESLLRRLKPRTRIKRLFGSLRSLIHDERSHAALGTDFSLEPLIVLDVGCRWGFAERFLEAADRFRIFGFDPDREECERLQGIYEGRNVTLVPFGLAGTEGKRILHLTHQPGCSSLLKPIQRLTDHYPALFCAREERQVEVETTTLRAWAKTSDVSRIDYMKVDTQGTELEILKGGEKLLKTARALEIEVEFNPIYEGQPLFSEVELYLRSLGFVLWKFTNHVHYSRHPEPNPELRMDGMCFNENLRIERPMHGGQLFWADAHFVSKKVLEEKDPAQRFRDEVLFETLGMPDVLQDRIEWRDHP